jgi:hypothetical protein
MSAYSETVVDRLIPNSKGQRQGLVPRFEPRNQAQRSAATSRRGHDLPWPSQRGGDIMNWLGWTFGVMFFTLYVFCIFTVCMVTFQKGRVLLGIAGIFLPFLWLIGAILPARKGSSYDIAQQSAYGAQAQQYTA